MLRNYLLTALRNLARGPLYTAINILGLALGLATAFVLWSWVRYEQRFDRNLPGYERTYRVVTHWKDGDEANAYATTYPMVKPRVVDRFPEVEASTRLFNSGFLGGTTRITIGNQRFTDDRLFYADSSFFRVFPYPLLQGNPEQVFSHPNGVVLTERVARKYFGSAEAIGQVLRLDNQREFLVTGVMPNLSTNTHFQFDLLANIKSHPWIKEAEEALWSGISFHTYARLREHASADELAAKMNAYLADFPNDPEHYGAELNLVMQPVTDIHLRSDLKFEAGTNGNITYVYLFSSIALLVLVVAVVNYINLATARYAQRTKEVGVRKMMGAARTQLIIQFLLEGMLISTSALAVTAVLIEVARPFWVGIMGVDFVGTLYTPNVLLALTGLGLSIGVISGFFPALVLSQYNPTRLFRSTLEISRGITLRQFLLVFQFAVSILLTVCTSVVYRQLNYVQEAELGYSKEQVVAIRMGYPDVRARFQMLKARLLTVPGVQQVSATSQLPSQILTAENVDVAGGASHGVYYVSVDQDFFSTLDVSWTAGQEQVAALDSVSLANKYVVSQQALQLFNWTTQQALNQNMTIRHGNMKPGPVVGVVRDFHFQSLHHPLAPLVYEFTPSMYEYLLIKLEAGGPATVLNDIKHVWQQFAAATPFDCSYLDQEYARLYEREQRMGSLFFVFASVASFIALMGLFALVSFAVVRKTREIGIRKILGATTRDVMHLLTQDFVSLLLVALLIALPLGYWGMNLWLEGFAYRTNFPTALFVAAALVNVLLAGVTLSYHALRAARANPAEAVKTD
jgi:putative ABC transport system permease protein